MINTYILIYNQTNFCLSQVQRRYNVVRASSMRDNKELQDILADTIQSVTDQSESTGLVMSSN